MCEICSKLTIKIPKRHNLHRAGVFIVNFEHFRPFYSAFVVDFEQVNANCKIMIVTVKCTQCVHQIFVFCVLSMLETHSLNCRDVLN